MSITLVRDRDYLGVMNMIYQVTLRDQENKYLQSFQAELSQETLAKKIMESEDLGVLVEVQDLATPPSLIYRTEIN